MAEPRAVEEKKAEHQSSRPRRTVMDLVAMVSPWAALLASLGFLLLLIVNLPLNIDEIEFFRATQWVREGLLPYRDFWEHHTPLHWVLMAPAAALVKASYSSGFIWMRTANLVWTLGTVGLVAGWMRRRGLGSRTMALLIAALLGAQSVTQFVAEYRPDALMNFLLVAGIIAVEHSLEKPRRDCFWLWGGGVMWSLACLTSQRMAPVVVASGLLYLLVPAPDRWGRRARGLWVLAGGLAVAVAFVGFIWLQGGWRACFDQTVLTNGLFEKTLSRNPYGSFLWQLFGVPFSSLEFGTMLLWPLAVMALLHAARKLGKCCFQTRLVILTVVQVGFLCAHGTPHRYQFQTLWWLLVLLGADILLEPWARDPVRMARIALIGGLLVIGAVVAEMYRAPWSFWKAVQRHQNLVMARVDQVTSPGEAVWDGTGYGLHRDPAFRYWFLQRGIRSLTQKGLLPPFNESELVQRRPAALVMDNRLMLYIRDQGPRMVTFVARHYLPLDTALWVPAPNVLLTSGDRSYEWQILKRGIYRAVLAPSMVGSPWFKDPLAFSYLEYLDERHKINSPERFRLDARSLSPPGQADGLEWSLNGEPLSLPTSGRLDLRGGEHLKVRLQGVEPKVVLVLPERYPVFFEVPLPPVPLDLGLEMLYPEKP